MASPFRAFRKHQKQWLAVLGVLTMFSFVFLPIFLDKMGGGGRPKITPVVTTTRFGTLYEPDLQQLRQQRQTILNFLNQVATKIREQGGYARDAMQMANEIGLVDDESTVTSWLLSQRARELGIVVSDKSVSTSLQTVMRGFAFNQPAKDAKDAKPQLREIRLGNADLKKILGSIHIGSAQFAEIWRTELMAQTLIREFAFSLDGMPPGQRWDYFQRFSRRATVEVIPVSVDSVLEQEKVSDADEATLKAFFEKHKNQLPSPTSPEPGFRQPHQIAVEYLKADQNKYVDRAAVTDKEIADYYEQFKDVYYREEPAKPAAQTPAAQTPAAQTPAAEKPAAKTPAAAATPAQAKPAEKQPVAPKAAPDKAPAKKAEESKPAQPAKAKEPPKPAPAAKPAATTPPAEKPASGKPEQKPAAGSPSKPADAKATPDAKKSSGVGARSVFHFAAFQAKKDDAKPAAPPAKSAEPAAKPAEKAAKPAEKPAEPAAKTAEPATPKPKDVPETIAPPKYIPLAQVREKIRDTLAQRQANAKMQQALVGLQDSLDEYHQKWLNWKVGETTRTKGEPLPPPPRPDLQELAKRHNLVYQQIPPVSAWDVKGFDISSSNVSTGAPEAGGGTPFIAYAFETLTEFRPTISLDTVGNAYLFWKTQDIAERVPSFDDTGVADQVQKTWKRVQARSLARKKAEALADDARKAQQSLTRLFGTRPGFVVTKTEPFPWFTFGAIPARFATEQSRPQISDVRGVEQPGDQFMSTVFKLPLGETAVAPNQPETIYYVIRAVDFTPSLDELWKSFRDGADVQSIYRIASRDQQEAMRAWMTSLKTSAGLKWEREPYRARQD